MKREAEAAAGARPRLLIVMGANGAGKSTLYERDPFAGRLPESFFNLDEIAAEMGDSNDPALQRRAGVLVSSEIRSLLARGQSFGFETTYAGKTRPAIVRRARAAGFYVEGIFIGTETPEINIKRVEERFAAGGHYIKPEDIRRRWHRSRENVVDTWNEFDALDFVDASTEVAVLVACKTKRGLTSELDDDERPEWFRHIVREVGDREAARRRAEDPARGRGPAP